MVCERGNTGGFSGARIRSGASLASECVCARGLKRRTSSKWNGGAHACTYAITPNSQYTSKIGMAYNSVTGVWYMTASCFNVRK